MELLQFLLGGFIGGGSTTGGSTTGGSTTGGSTTGGRTTGGKTTGGRTTGGLSFASVATLSGDLTHAGLKGTSSKERCSGLLGSQFNCLITFPLTIKHNCVTLFLIT